MAKLEDPNREHREAERNAAKKANAAMQVPVNEARERHLLHRESDPFPSIAPALLNSAHIADYVFTTGMISPFHPERLKSASYEVPLLGPYVYVDNKGRKKTGVLKEGDEITVAKNSITFLTVEPTFRLPDYIALRHNLKIDHVYKGLLVGTGPLIDPGFVGRISLPLHNLTENDYTFKGGEGIIWVEFTKLSKIPGAPDSTNLGVAAGQYVSFPAERTESRLVRDYIRGGVEYAAIPASSTATTARTADKAKRSVDRRSAVGLIAIAALTLGLGGYMTNAIAAGRGETDRNEQKIENLEKEIADLESQLDDSLNTRQQPSVPSTP